MRLSRKELIEHAVDELYMHIYNSRFGLILLNRMAMNILSLTQNSLYQHSHVGFKILSRNILNNCHRALIINIISVQAEEDEVLEQ